MKSLIIALFVVAGTAQAQTCESKFSAELAMVSPICFTNEDCQKEINKIKACLSEDYTDRYGNTVKGTIAKLEADIVENTKKIALEKKQESLPGVRIGMSAKTVINETQWGAPTKISQSVNQFQ